MGFRAEEKQILGDSITTFGDDLQYRLLAEETAELCQEALKYLRGLGSCKNLASEIADVEIMIEKIKMVRGIDFRVLVEKCRHENLEEIKTLTLTEIKYQEINNKKGVGHHQ